MKLLHLLALVPCAVTVAAPRLQEGEPSEAQQKEALRRLDEHDRVELHPAEDPLVVVGREQGDNDLRSRTPALARVEHGVAQVDPEELYARAIALHEGRVFHAPSRAAEPGHDSRGAPTRSTRELSEVTARPDESARGWGLRVFVGGVLIALGFVLHRVLRARSG